MLPQFDDEKCNMLLHFYSSRKTCQNALNANVCCCYRCYRECCCSCWYCCCCCNCFCGCCGCCHYCCGAILAKLCGDKVDQKTNCAVIKELKMLRRCCKRNCLLGLGKREKENERKWDRKKTKQKHKVIELKGPQTQWKTIEHNLEQNKTKTTTGQTLIRWEQK